MTQLLNIASKILKIDAISAFFIEGSPLSEYNLQWLSTGDKLVFVEAIDRNNINRPNERYKIVNGHKILDFIGKGSFGKVYKAQNLTTNTMVALKYIKKIRLKNSNGNTCLLIIDVNRIFIEIQNLQIISHENIIQFMGSMKASKIDIDTKSNVILILEYAGGGDLKQ